MEGWNMVPAAEMKCIKTGNDCGILLKLKSNRVTLWVKTVLGASSSVNQKVLTELILKIDPTFQLKTRRVP